MDGDDSIAALKLKNFICWERKPGVVSVVLDMGANRSATELITEGGKSYFLDIQGRISPKPAIISERYARELIKNSTPVSKADYIPFD